MAMLWPQGGPGKEESHDLARSSAAAVPGRHEPFKGLSGGYAPCLGCFGSLGLRLLGPGSTGARGRRGGKLRNYGHAGQQTAANLDA